MQANSGKIRCDKFDLYSIVSDSEVVMSNVLVTHILQRILYDYRYGLNNLLIFQVIKTHSVPANVNYTNLL